LLLSAISAQDQRRKSQTQHQHNMLRMVNKLPVVVDHCSRKRELSIAPAT
jgi:hypothetical protein